MILYQLLNPLPSAHQGVVWAVCLVLSNNTLKGFAYCISNQSLVAGSQTKWNHSCLIKSIYKTKGIQKWTTPNIESSMKTSVSKVSWKWIWMNLTKMDDWISILGWSYWRADPSPNSSYVVDCTVFSLLFHRWWMISLYNS